MLKATGYSLWLVPERGAKTYELLNQLICNVAVRYQTPTFDPHITLLGGVEGIEHDMLEKTRVLAEQLTPYEAQLGEVGSNGIYFQILFSEIRQTPSVLNANTIAQNVFGVDKGKYFPHLSLAYGNLSREQVATLQRFVRQENLIAKMRFPAQGIELWRSQEAVEKWREVAVFPFRKSLLNEGRRT